MYMLAGHLIASLFLGGLISLLIMILMYVGITQLSSRRQTLISVVVAIICFFCLMWQSVRMVGAFYVKDYVRDLSTLISASLSEQSVSLGSSVSEIKEHLSQQYPIFENYIHEVPIDESVANADSTSIVSFFCEYVQYELNIYIAWRIGYILILCGLFAWILILTMKKKSSYAGISWN